LVSSAWFPEFGVLSWGNRAPEAGGAAGGIPGEPSGAVYMHRSFKKLSKNPQRYLKVSLVYLWDINDVAIPHWCSLRTAICMKSRPKTTSGNDLVRVLAGNYLSRALAGNYLVRVLGTREAQRTREAWRTRKARMTREAQRTR